VNPGSCWGAPTLWSLFCFATLLSSAFKRTRLFDPESLGGWRRDSVREMDIVTGCLLLAPRSLWEELGGFDTRFFMYGEDADLSLRAKALGYRPAITPDAVVTHEIGVSSSTREDKLMLLFRGKATLLRKHWRGLRLRLGLFLLSAGLRSLLSRGRGSQPSPWTRVWRNRSQWLPRFRSLRRPSLELRLQVGSRGAMSDHDRSYYGSLKWAFYMTWADRAFSVAFTCLLAAILGPRDFGIVALALIYIAVVQALPRGRVPDGRRPAGRLRGGHLDLAFWVNFAWCVLLAGASFLLAGWWARLNGIPELEDVVRVLSVLLLVYGLTVVQLALFQREMRFRALAIWETVAVLVGGVLGLVLALRGAGVWALVTQQLGFDVTQLVLLWGMSTWRPRFRFSGGHARDLLGFSSGVFLSNLGGFLTVAPTRS
jgi:Polysaccharide biosynthesis protein